MLTFANYSMRDFETRNAHIAHIHALCIIIHDYYLRLLFLFHYYSLPYKILHCIFPDQLFVILIKSQRRLELY